jgi:hypothetical protein
VVPPGPSPHLSLPGKLCLHGLYNFLLGYGGAFGAVVYDLAFYVGELPPGPYPDPDLLTEASYPGYAPLTPGSNSPFEFGVDPSSNQTGIQCLFNPALSGPSSGPPVPLVAVGLCMTFGGQPRYRINVVPFLTPFEMPDAGASLNVGTLAIIFNGLSFADGITYTP